ncbi:MAG: DUF4173 domain-containing protein [Acidimicrobiales bacterium]
MTATPWTSAPPMPFEPPVSLDVDRQADAAVLAACAVAAVGVDLAVRSGIAGLAAASVPAAVCASLVATRRFPNPQARVLLALAPVLTAFLAIRTSGVVVLPDILAAALLVATAAGLARGGSLLDLTFPGLAGRLALTTTHGVLAPAFLLRPLGRLAAQRAGSWALVRGLAIGLPLVVVLTALLASADAVFASLLNLPDVADLGLHVLLLALGACAAATVLRQASARTADLPLGRAPALGRLESRIVLGGLCGVYTAFACTQVAVAAGAADRILSEEGLTYAEYARQGFFQLLAAAGLTAVVLLCVRAGGALGDSASTVLVLLAVVLTEVVVAVAVHRLSLYEDAYGLTLLRLLAVAGALWVGAVFFLIGMAVAGAAPGRSWLPGAIGGAALIALLGWNLADPAALVARRNLDRAKPDAAYRAGLGDDAVPTIVARLPGLDPAIRADLVQRICDAPHEARTGPLEWNLAATRATESRQALRC